MKFLLSVIVFIFFIFACAENRHKKVIVKDASGFFKEEFTVIDDSIKDGTYKKYYGNGILWDSCYYKNDTLQGQRKIYDNNGNLEIIENYKDGVLDGEYLVFYPDGQIKIRQFFKDNVLSDTSYVYYKNGVLKEKVCMADNKENGPFEEYYESGVLHWKGRYLDGDNEQDTLYEYDRNGILIRKMLCDKGICHTIWKKNTQSK